LGFWLTKYDLKSGNFELVKGTGVNNLTFTPLVVYHIKDHLEYCMSGIFVSHIPESTWIGMDQSAYISKKPWPSLSQRNINEGKTGVKERAEKKA
jgi:hypothetical protein